MSLWPCTTLDEICQIFAQRESTPCLLNQQAW